MATPSTRIGLAAPLILIGTLCLGFLATPHQFTRSNASSYTATDAPRRESAVEAPPSVVPAVTPSDSATCMGSPLMGPGQSIEASLIAVCPVGPAVILPPDTMPPAARPFGATALPEDRDISRASTQ